MPVWFRTRGRQACRPIPRGQPGVAQVLAATVVGLTLLGAQCRQPDRSEVASAGADAQAQVQVPSSSREDAEGCLPDGSGSLKVMLSGAVQYSIEWDNDDMDCGGFGSSDVVAGDAEPTMVSFQSLQFAGVPAGAGSQVDLKFNIQVGEGATGTDLPARVGIMERASERYFETSEWGGCTANVTEQSLIDENPAFRSYRLAANGSCTEPSVQYSPGPSAGVSGITVVGFELIGIAVWMGPPK